MLFLMENKSRWNRSLTIAPSGLLYEQYGKNNYIYINKKEAKKD